MSRCIYIIFIISIAHKPQGCESVCFEMWAEYQNGNEKGSSVFNKKGKWQAALLFWRGKAKTSAFLRNKDHVSPGFTLSRNIM